MLSQTLKDEVERLRIDQQLERGKTRKCPYDGEFCGEPEDWACTVPVFLGESHDVIIDWTSCPRYRRSQR